MLKEKVIHTSYGKGMITAVEEEYVTVTFDKNGDKTFVYPDSFESKLKFENKKLQAKALETLQEKEEIRRSKINKIVKELDDLAHTPCY